jgi:hypothetical protein
MKPLFLIFLSFALLSAQQDLDLISNNNDFLVPMKRTHNMTETPKIAHQPSNEPSNEESNDFLDKNMNIESEKANFNSVKSTKGQNKAPIELPTENTQKGQDENSLENIEMDSKAQDEPLNEIPNESDLSSEPKKRKNTEIAATDGKSLDRFQVLEETLKKYIAPQQNVMPVRENKAYLWQENINYIEPLYLRTFVRKLVVSQPISTWPLCVKTLVFPQVYAYYPVSVLRPQLMHVYQNTVKENSEIKDSKVDLLEKLMKLEELKKNVEIAILDQTEKLLEARKYDERTNKLMSYLEKQEAKISQVDEMLEDVNK